MFTAPAAWFQITILIKTTGKLRYQEEKTEGLTGRKRHEHVLHTLVNIINEPVKDGVYKVTMLRRLWKN